MLDKWWVWVIILVISLLAGKYAPTGFNPWRGDDNFPWGSV